MKEDDRICVSISRARKGLYIFGNIPALVANSPLWFKIINTATEMGCVGTHIPIRCPQHGTEANFHTNEIICTTSAVMSTTHTASARLKQADQTFCNKTCPMVVMQNILFQQTLGTRALQQCSSTS
jgi:hypothetical protein